MLMRLGQIVLASEKAENGSIINRSAYDGSAEVPQLG